MWYAQVTQDNLVQGSRLCVPSCVDALPQLLRPAMQDHAAYHQYRVLIFMKCGEVPTSHVTQKLSYLPLLCLPGLAHYATERFSPTPQQNTCGNCNLTYV